MADGLEGADFSSTIYQCQGVSAQEADLSRRKREYFAWHGLPALLGDLRQSSAVRIAAVVAKRPIREGKDLSSPRPKLMLALFPVVTRIRSFIPG